MTLALLFPAAPASGQAGGAGQGDTGTTHLVWMDATVLLPTEVSLPTDYDSTKSYPLVVALHGIGGTPAGMMRLAPLFTSSGIIYAVPQGSYAFWARDRIGYSWNLAQIGSGAPDPEATAWSLKYIADIARGLARQFHTEEVYLFGFSQGGAFTLMAGLNHPEIFTGLIAFAGGMNPRWYAPGVLERGRRIRAYIAHSPEDEAVAYEVSILARDALEALDYDVTFNAYEGGHVLRPELVSDAIAWLREGSQRPK
jgi:phospholipase/carboxylesterase